MIIPDCLHKLKKATALVCIGLTLGTSVFPAYQQQEPTVSARTFNLAPVYASVYQFEKLSRLYDTNTWTGKLYYLSNFTNGNIPEEQLSKVLSLVMDDFYWVRILALQKIYQNIKNNPAQYRHILRQIQKTDLSGAAKIELEQWIILVKQKANGIIKKSQSIRRFKKKALKEYLSGKEHVNIMNFLNFLEYLRQVCVNMSQEYLDAPVFQSQKIQIAVWDSFEINHTEQKIPVLDPKYGMLKKQPKLIAWQFLLDMVILNRRIEGKSPEGQIDTLLTDLSDKGLLTAAEIKHYQKRIDNAIEKNNRTKKINRAILEMTVEIANHRKNQVEKGRVGALLLTPSGKIIGAAFDGAPAAMGSDTEHMHGEIAEDLFIPKPNGEADSKSLRWRFDWRRSPCAEKKALFQGLLAMQRGEISAEDFFASKIYSSRQPCYQCTLFLNQLGFRESISPGDIVISKPGEIKIERDRATSIIDRNCAFEHTFVQKVDVLGTAQKIKDENYHRLAKELNIKDGAIPAKTLWRLYNDNTGNVTINDFRYGLFDLRTKIRKENYASHIRLELQLAT